MWRVSVGVVTVCAVMSSMALACGEVDVHKARQLQQHAAGQIETWAQRQAVAVLVQPVGHWGRQAFQPGRYACQQKVVALDVHTRRMELHYVRSDAGADADVGAPHGSFFTARFLVRDAEPVWRLSMPVHIGQALDCERHLVRDLRAIRRGTAAPSAGGCDDLAGLEFRRSLGSGAVLSASDLRTPPVVRQRSAVTAQVMAGAITIDVQATALEDGQLGQQITLVSPGARSVLKGLVVGAGRVSIQ